MARKFTDPGVSIKERFRALSKSNAEANREVIEVQEGKCRHDGRRMRHMGELSVRASTIYSFARQRSLFLSICITDCRNAQKQTNYSGAY